MGHVLERLWEGALQVPAVDEDHVVFLAVDGRRFFRQRIERGGARKFAARAPVRARKGKHSKVTTPMRRNMAGPFHNG